MEFLGELLFTILIGLVTSQIYDGTEKFARRTVGWAVRLLPAMDRERYNEEWLSHLEECDGKLGKLWHALGCVRASGTGRAKWSVDLLIRYLMLLSAEAALGVALRLYKLSDWIAPELADEYQQHHVDLLAQIAITHSLRSSWFKTNKY